MLKSIWKKAIKSNPIYLVILVFSMLTGCVIDIPTQGALITEKNAQPHPFPDDALYAVKKKKDGRFESGKAMTFKIINGTNHDYEMSMLNKDGSIDKLISPVRFLGLSNGFYLISLSDDENIPDQWKNLILHYENGGLGLIEEDNVDFTEFLMQNAKELAQWTEGEKKYLIIKNREKTLEQIKLFLQKNQAQLKYTDEVFDKKGLERFLAKNKP